jgi:hypothetical protein
MSDYNIHKLLKDKTKVTTILVFIIVAIMFVILVNTQRSQLDPALKIKTLEQTGKIIKLDTWNVSFESCQGKNFTSCEHVGNDSYEIKFPAPEKLTRITKDLSENIGSPVNKAYMDISLDFTTMAWIRSQKGTVNLVIPQFLATAVKTTHPVPKQLNQAFAHDIVVNFHKNELERGFIRLEVYIYQNEYWFGPDTFPPALATYVGTGHYADIDQLIKTTSHLNRMMLVLIPLLITAMALIIDHSAGLMFLSLYTASFSIRSVIAMMIEFSPGDLISTILIFVLAFVYGLSCALLVRFAIHMSEIKLRALYTLFISILAGAVCLVTYSLDESGQNIVSMDMWVDAIGSGISCLILLFAIIKISTGKWKITSTQINASKRVKIFVLATASVFLFISFYANTKGLLTYYTEGTKDFLSWADYILIPGLLFSTFLNIGSIVNTIERVSSIVKEKTRIDRDLEIGKELQSGILPDKKAKGIGWSWHAFYYPAAHLAGDWFDLREIKFKDGKTALIACVVDVTGHGISSAMMTSNIASHWSLWCDSVSEINYPSTQAELDGVISTAPSQIHRGLVGLRYNLGCSMAVSMFEPKTRNFTYLTAGHPGIIIGSDSTFEYLTTIGTRPGVKTSNSQWEVSNKTLGDDVNQIILYSDGIVEIDRSVPVWLKHIRRDAKKSKNSITSYFTSQLRKNRKTYLNNPDIEDDLTLLIIKI